MVTNKYKTIPAFLYMYKTTVTSQISYKLLVFIYRLKSAATSCYVFQVNQKSCLSAETLYFNDKIVYQCAQVLIYY